MATRMYVFVGMLAALGSCDKPLPVTFLDGGAQGDASEDGGSWDSVLCTPGTCPVGMVCLWGTCVPTLPDNDRDGRNSAVDCDDEDRTIGGPNFTETCYPGQSCAPEDACMPFRRECVNREWNCEAWGDCDWTAGDECACIPGEVDQVPCGSCGILSMLCVEEDESGNPIAPAWHYLLDDGAGNVTTTPNAAEACEQPTGACAPGTEQPTGSCGQCGGGQLMQSCDDTCQWAPFVVCRGAEEQVCPADSEETDYESCGTCGIARARTRSCSTECAWDPWSTWSECTAVDGCDPETDVPYAEQLPCQQCGVRERTVTCNPTSCLWGASAWGECTDQGDCEGNAAYGTVDTEQGSTTCGNCSLGTKTRTRTCRIDCTWPNWAPWDMATCVDTTSECEVGAVDIEDEACSSCPSGSGRHSRQRDCTSGCMWNEWGAWTQCNEECTPGQEETVSCSSGCGSAVKTRTCNATTCEWNEWGQCEGTGGECEGGETQPCTCDCGAGSYDAVKSCDGASCSWQSCDNECENIQCNVPSSEPATEYYPGCQPTRYHTRTHDCQTNCSWGGWSSWGAWIGGCAPGAVDEDSASCTCSAGGGPEIPRPGPTCSRSRSRTCSTSCAWGGWGSWRGCSGSSWTEGGYQYGQEGEMGPA